MGSGSSSNNMKNGATPRAHGASRFCEGVSPSKINRGAIPRNTALQAETNPPSNRRRSLKIAQRFFSTDRPPNAKAVGRSPLRAARRRKIITK